MIVKKLLTIIIFLSMVFTSFAFTTLGETGSNQDYFSLDSSIVKVVTKVNSSNLTVNYSIGGNFYSKDYELTSCLSEFCVDVNLGELKEAGNSSISFADSFLFSMNGETKTVYLDLEKPQVTNVTFDLDIGTKELTLTYLLSDNSNKLIKADLYIITDNVKEKLASILNSSSYKYVISESKNYSFEFDLTDEALNTNQETSDFEIGDIFKPELISYKFIENLDSKSLELKLKDDVQLKSYKLSQGTLELSEDLTGLETTKLIPLPFTSGTLNLDIEDDNGNIQTNSIPLTGSVSYSSYKKYNSDSKLSFTSDGTSCTLTKLNGVTKNTILKKSGTTFTLDISSSKFKEIPVVFYCDKTSYRKYFSETFYYDNEKPDEITITGSVEDNGDIFLEWNEAKDAQTEVEYSLYREGKKIYQGSKSKYSDSKAYWPNNYNYEVRVEDLAGNYRVSNEVELEPKKVDVVLYTTNEKEVTTKENSYTALINSEKDAIVSVKVLSGNAVTYQEEKTFTKTSDTFTLPLVSGLNKIEITSKDTFGNSKSTSYYVTYEQPVLAAPISTPSTTEPVVSEPVKTNTISEKIPKVVEEVQGNIDTSYSSYFWFFFILIIASVLIWYLLTNEDMLRRKFAKQEHKYNKSRKQDLILGSSLNKVKKQRIQRQNTRAEDKRKKEENKERVTSEYNQQKLKDIQERREVKIPMTTRIKAKRTSNRAKKQVEYSEVLDKVKKEVVKKGFFEKVFASFKKQEVKQDEFSNYIHSKKQEQSWDSTRGYRASHLEKLRKQEEEKIAAIAKEKAEEEQRQRLESLEQQRKDEVKRKADELEADRARPKTGDEYRKEIKKHRVDLDGYLSKKTKKKSWFFAEKEVERDLRK